MDSTAFALCRDNELPIVVFDLTRAGNIQRVVFGEPIGTIVGGSRRRDRGGGAMRRRHH